MLRTPLAAAGLALILIATNPTQDEYASWLADQAVNSGSIDKQVLEKGLVSLVGAPLIKLSTVRQSFLFFSLFTTRLGNQTPIVFFGVMRIFVPLNASVTEGQGPPAPHIAPADAQGHWLPEDGYVWIVNPPPPGDLRVRWEPGRMSSGPPHVVAADVEGRWLPEDGYQWIVNPPVPGDFRVRWEPGRLSRQYAHVVATSDEGQWLPERGYAWVASPPRDGDFRVKYIGP